MKTLAIVIGNNEYHDTAKLEYAVNDATEIASVFERLGYDVEHINNCTSNQCSEILITVASRIEHYDATIFFFAGHGFQFEGDNYLTSIECQIPPTDKYNCGRNSIMLSELLDIYKKHPNKINIVIIDACRKSFGRGSDTTFSPVQAPQGTLIAFSTSPEEGAKDDGFGNHSVYTGALLKYIGREMLSVEELFKKVRKTVNTLSGGKQTPWEHTSLIGDFYFNIGQLVYSLNLPYSDEVVKDVNYKGKPDDFSMNIFEVKKLNWNLQNPALDQLLSYRSGELDKNQQFILGRNLLQSARHAFRADDFFEYLQDNLKYYSSQGENHVLNGILFEIYFDSRGEFRREHFKAHYFEEIMALRKNLLFKKSFDFIAQQVSPFQQIRVFWIPSTNDSIVDVDVQVTSENMDDGWGVSKQYEMINKIKVLSVDITEQIKRYGLHGLNAIALKKAVVDFLCIPESLIEINTNKEIKLMAFRPSLPSVNS